MDRRLELVVDHEHLVKVLLEIALYQHVADLARPIEAEIDEHVGEEVLDHAAPVEIGVPFAPHHGQLERVVVVAIVAYEALRRADDVGVEATAEAAVAGDAENEHVLRLAHLEQRMHIGFTARCETRDHLVHAHRVGPRGEDHVLRLLQPRRRDELHRVGDLLRVFDRPDSGAELFDGGHWLTLLALRVC